MELILCTPQAPQKRKWNTGIPYHTIVLSSEGPIKPYNIPTLTVQQLSHNRVRQNNRIQQTGKFCGT